MFTGLVEAVGTILAVAPMPGGVRLRIEAGALTQGLGEGASIAVDGVCLTALEIDSGAFSADVSPETLSRTNMGEYRAGTPVNLERPLRAGDPLGGHFVQGHVDAICEAGETTQEDDFVRFRVRVPTAHLPYLVEKGSVAVNGVSLTVASMETDGFDVQLVPHTLERTNLLNPDRATSLNLEVDILGKYVARFVAPHLPGSGDDSTEPR
ncbi:MAG: riboflavin synthase [Acidobacteria bacterium]|nr:riboflavin synthase [Acidobacteriota bacterium]